MNDPYNNTQLLTSENCDEENITCWITMDKTNVVHYYVGRAGLHCSHPLTDTEVSRDDYLAILKTVEVLVSRRLLDEVGHIDFRGLANWLERKCR